MTYIMLVKTSRVELKYIYIFNFIYRYVVCSQCNNSYNISGITGKVNIYFCVSKYI